MKIGYLRRDDFGDEVDSQRQRHRLEKAGCEYVFEDNSGSQAVFENAYLKKPQLARAQLSITLEALHPGDKLVVCRLIDIGLSVRGLAHLLDSLSSNDIYFASLDELIDTSETKTGNCLPALSKSLSNLDVKLASERSEHSRAIAKAKGLTGGRPKLISQDILNQASLLIEGGTSVRQAATLVKGVSQATLYRRVGAKKV